MEGSILTYLIDQYELFQITLYSIKIIEKGSLFEFIRTRKLIINKIISLKKINHPKIIKILEVYEDQTSIYLIIEYC